MYQVLTIITLIILLFFVDVGDIPINVTPGMNGMAFILMLLGALFILGVTGCAYLLLMLQLQKKPDLFQARFWKSAPILLLIIGIISITVYLMLGMSGSLFEWVDEQRWIMYGMIVYFIWLFYFWIVSIVNRQTRDKQKVPGYSLGIGVVVLLIIIYMI
ncbi:hypothetical protein R3398_03020 [Rossellomorea marisflavi]|uniref:hypothetical protein n=1 Tax=Rossellomorea marisflavi TaxID=189381 RepID=UPI0025B20070|nr:hypothetical protein [Rossellomorea marisflavi]MDW4525343.1 hypothetical protein [Rossellomorea marisflavi]WJV18210.1 hypothetical protein QU593_19075 [Rossellomorea marisflavi]